ncbi:MAG TPA: PDZ domain-containing protein [Vicinamibacterales bacterium]|nr:PDZ domain-containing protein [Vicinamibacterales bacterium]
MLRRPTVIVFAALLSAVSAASQGQGTQAPITYRVTFPEPEHHWMQVEATFADLGQQPLDARMSRSSPGRYAVAEFAKNVFFVEAFDGNNQKLAYTRPEADVWRVSGHDGTVRVVYKIFGDYANATYLGVDTTHGHLNMPAAFMWANGHEDRGIQLTFVPPAGLNWKIGTQLFATSDPNTFTAPNLQYFMDSPTELSDFLASRFTVTGSDGTAVDFRLVVHSDGSQADVDELAKLVERLVREQMAVYGEFPTYEPGHYTFLLDYVPWGSGDAMEHRNSSSISNPRVSIRTAQGRQQALANISHEYFHSWNVERIRPAGLEPFDFTRENVTCCLWLAEGFTQYYGQLLLTRAGLAGQSSGPPAAGALGLLNTASRGVRSAVQMSEYAPFADGAGTFVDVSDANRTFYSYYGYGSALALALDLSLRERSSGRQSLDDYMKLLWNRHGKPGGAAPGLVGQPYSLDDLRDRMAELTSDRPFADEFFEKYIEGTDIPDYPRLLALAGYRLEAAASSRGWIGNVSVAETPEGLAVGVVGSAASGNPVTRAMAVPFNTPLYEAGIDSGDVIRAIDDRPATTAAWNEIGTRKPGEPVTLTVMRRGGAAIRKTITLKADPTVQRLVSMETVTTGQSAFRAAWLGTRVR